MSPWIPWSRTHSPSTSNPPVRDAAGIQCQATGQDRNSILVDYDIFVKVPRLDASDLSSLQKLYKAEDSDFRLARSGSMDRGTILPTVTNGFAGRAQT